MDLHLRRQARPDHRRIEGHRRRGGRSLCRGRLLISASPRATPSARSAGRTAARRLTRSTRPAHAADLRKPDDLARLAEEAADIDILVNNAGDIPGGSIDKIDEATWRHAWELKVFGYINLTRASTRR